MEQVDITPIQPPAVTAYTIERLTLDWQNAVIDVVLRDNLGTTQAFTYGNAAALMKALNTANLSVKSLYRRVLEKLIADGKIVGTVSGTP